MKILKKSEHPVHPRLEELLTKLYHRVPCLNFESWDIRFMDGNGRVISAVKVYNGNEEVGVIAVEYTSFRKQGNCDVYTISSPRITNRIAPRNAKVTKLPTEALKIAIKTFSTASTVFEVIENVKMKMTSEVNGVAYNATRQAERLGEDHILPLMELAMVVSRGEVPTLDADLTKMLSQANLERVINTAWIASAVATDYKANSGIIVKEERDGSLLGVLMDTSMPAAARVVKYSDTYELPEIYQTKLAMLRMLENKQPVESIGIKFLIGQINWYYLTGGEIITTS